MPTNLSTRPHLSDIQVVQLSGESITLSGTTNFAGILKSKDVEIDATVTNSVSEEGYVLRFDGVKIALAPSTGGKPSLLNKKMPVIAGNTNDMLVSNEPLYNNPQQGSYITILLDGIEFETGVSLYTANTTFYFSPDYVPMGVPTTIRAKGTEVIGDYCYVNCSQLPYGVVTSDMELSFHYLTSDMELSFHYLTTD